MTNYILIDQILRYLWEFWIFVFMILLHETGHYLACIYYKIKPKIYLSWMGIFLKTYKFQRIKLLHFLVISWAGILAGFIPYLFFDIPDYVSIAYIFACSLDALNIYIMTNSYKKYGNITLWQASDNHHKEEYIQLLMDEVEAV